MNILNPKKDRLLELIYASVHKEIEKITDEEIAKMVAAIQLRARMEAARISVVVCEKITFERLGTDIKMTVCFPGAEAFKPGSGVMGPEHSP